MMFIRPIAPSFIRQICPPRRCYATRYANKKGLPLKNMPRKERDSDKRQLKADSARRRALDDVPNSLQPLRISSTGLALQQGDGVKEKYTVRRTPTKNLPVYQLTKGGGNLKLTRVRKVEGDTEALRAQLEAFLNPTPKYVKINPITGHIFMKGWYKNQVEQILKEKGF